MAIAISCGSCGGRFNAPDHAAGRKTKCPTCRNALVVPSSSSPIATAESQVIASVNQPQEKSKLINCDACGHKIATSAPTCPQCGAVNKWVHPEIQRFVNSLERFANMPRFNVNYERDILKGIAEVKRGGYAYTDWGTKALGVGMLCMVAGFFLSGDLEIIPWIIGPVAALAGMVLLVLGMFQPTGPTDFIVSFVVDFSKSPSVWQSDDEHFWKDVKAFFFPPQGS